MTSRAKSPPVWPALDQQSLGRRCCMLALVFLCACETPTPSEFEPRSTNAVRYLDARSNVERLEVDEPLYWDRVDFPDALTFWALAREFREETESGSPIESTLQRMNDEAAKWRLQRHRPGARPFEFHIGMIGQDHLVFLRRHEPWAFDVADMYIVRIR